MLAASQSCAEYSTGKPKCAVRVKCWIKYTARMASAKILPRNISGPQIRRLRSQQGITQQAFAERCQRMGWDISRDTLAKVESQMRWLADFELAFLAEALAVPLDLLLPERGPTTQRAIREFVGRLSAGKSE